MTKPKKEQRATLAINNFEDGATIAERLFRGMDPDELFTDIQAQVRRAVENHGLSTADAEKLYHDERYNHQYEWPEHVREAVAAFYALHQAKECMDKNDAKWTAYHLLNAITHISLYNLMTFGDLITLGDKLVVAQREGGIASGETRREKSKENKDQIIREGKKLLADGKPQRDLVGILKQRYDFGETFIREALKEGGLLKGRGN